MVDLDVRDEFAPGGQLIRRVEHVWAENAVSFADVLRRQDASWGTDTFPLAGGHAVLCGPGLYVNRALAIGLGRPVAPADIDLLEARSRAVGVKSAVEVGPQSHPHLVDVLADRGYTDVGDSVATFVLPDTHPIGDAPGDGVLIERADGDLLALWQQTSAEGWGHADAEARRASDAFTRAAAVVDGPGFLLARDGRTGTPLGCASLTIRARVATLGGMSTIPSARGRGVQTAMIEHRIRMAIEAGCDVITSSALPDGGSARNLIRIGFRHWYLRRTFARELSRPSDSPRDDR